MKDNHAQPADVLSSTLSCPECDVDGVVITTNRHCAHEILKEIDF